MSTMFKLLIFIVLPVFCFHTVSDSVIDFSDIGSSHTSESSESTTEFEVEDNEFNHIDSLFESFRPVLVKQYFSFSVFKDYYSNSFLFRIWRPPKSFEFSK